MWYILCRYCPPTFLHSKSWIQQQHCSFLEAIFQRKSITRRWLNTHLKHITHIQNDCMSFQATDTLVCSQCWQIKPQISWVTLLKVNCNKSVLLLPSRSTSGCLGVISMSMMQYYRAEIVHNLMKVFSVFRVHVIGGSPCPVCLWPRWSSQQDTATHLHAHTSMRTHTHTPNT